MFDRVPDIASETASIWTAPVVRCLLHENKKVCAVARQASAKGVALVMCPSDLALVRASDVNAPTPTRVNGKAVGSSSSSVLPNNLRKSASVSSARSRKGRSSPNGLLSRLRQWSIVDAIDRKMQTCDGRTDVAEAWGYLVGMLGDDLMRPQTRGETAVVHTLVRVAQRLMENSDNDECSSIRKAGRGDTRTAVGAGDEGTAAAAATEWRVSGRRAALLLGWRYLMENFARRSPTGLIHRHLETFMKPICQFLSPAFLGVVVK
jgi:hypothetical protein